VPLRLLTQFLSGSEKAASDTASMKVLERDQKKNLFSTIWAERIDWIKAAMEDPNAVLHTRRDIFFTAALQWVRPD
jgi:hypothetical protein